MRAKIESIHCDFCGYGGAYTRPSDFRSFGDVDLCYWCAQRHVRNGWSAAGT